MALGGVAIGTDRSTFSVASRYTQGYVDGLHLAGYLAIRHGGLYLLGQAQGDFYSNTTDRVFAAFGVVQGLHGAFHSSAATGRVETGFELTAGPLGVTPFAAIRASNLHLDAYGETSPGGSSPFALAFASHNANSLQYDLGLRIEPSGRTPSAVSPFLSLAWRHESDPERFVVPTFSEFEGATPMIIAGAPEARDRAVIEGGLDWKVSRRTSVFASFTGDYGRGEANTAAQAGVRWTW
jgi:outer membrane autotransporter protein